MAKITIKGKGLYLVKCQTSRTESAANTAIMFIHEGCFTDPSLPQIQPGVQKDIWHNGRLTIKHF